MSYSILTGLTVVWTRKAKNQSSVQHVMLQICALHCARWTYVVRLPIDTSNLRADKISCVRAWMMALSNSL